MKDVGIKQEAWSAKSACVERVQNLRRMLELWQDTAQPKPVMFHLDVAWKSPFADVENEMPSVIH